MKDLASYAVASILALGMGGSMAWQNAQGPQVEPPCNLPYCEQVEVHSHGICSDQTCTSAVNHKHNGLYYYAHHDADGHNHSTKKQTAKHESNRPEALPSPVLQSVPNSCEVVGCYNTGIHNHASSNGAYHESEHTPSPTKVQPPAPIQSSAPSESPAPVIPSAPAHHPENGGGSAHRGGHGATHD